MVTAMIVIFVLGYLMIAMEHVLQVNKATFALLMCAILWSIYSMCGHDPHLNEGLIEALGDTCEIVVFLIGAMTIVEIIDKYDGFSFIVKRIKSGNKRGMMWILAFVAFFMSSVLDNMTTTIIMVMMLRRMLSDQKERWIYACVIVIAANAGGAWSPIGDVTTIMLWMKNYVSSVDLIVNLLAPSLLATVVSVFIASFFIKNEPMEKLNSQDVRKGPELSRYHKGISLTVLIVGVCCLLFVPIFKSITHLPPYMGVMLSLSVLWILTEIIVTKYNLDKKMEGRVTQAIRNIDMSTILFFLGILMAVNSLQHAHILSHMANYLDETLHEPYAINGIIGVLSSVVDNVPLVAACMNMYEVATPEMIQAAADPTYMQYFVEDGLFWHLLTFCAGVGGSMLIIGSAAGVVAMGIEKIPFTWYLRKFTWIAFAGYIAGMACIWAESIFMPHLG